MIEIDTGIVGAIVFFFLRFCRLFQEIITSIFEFIFLKPALALVKLLNVEGKRPLAEKKEIKNFIVLDTLILHHKILLNYLYSIFKINSFLNGVVAGPDIYLRLLTWNKQIPVVGFYADKMTVAIQLLLQKVENGRTIDLIWLTSHKVYGFFKVISKETPEKNKNEIILKCIWTSGPDAGTIFEVDKYFGLVLDPAKNKSKLSAIYYPPRLVVLLFEAFVSASAILAFLELSKGGWSLIKPFLSVLINKLAILYVYILKIFK